jgi:hypothetical protein
MIEVYKIPIPKDKLLAIPSDERALFILLGYAANQLNFFTKLVVFSTNKDGNSELEQTLSGAQSQMALRVVVGVLHEAWELIRTRLLATTYGKTIIDQLDPPGAEAFDRLKKEFGSNGMIAKLRNNWVSHHPDNAQLTAAFTSAAASKEWDEFGHWYFSHSNYNSFYMMNEFVALHGILNIVGETDLLEAQKKLTQTIVAIAEDMSQLIQAIEAALWKKYFGTDMGALDKIAIDNAPGFFDPWIPFFTDMEKLPPFSDS